MAEKTRRHQRGYQGGIMMNRLRLPPVIEVKSKRVFAVDSSHPPFPRRVFSAVG